MAKCENNFIIDSIQENLYEMYEISNQVRNDYLSAMVTTFII